MANHNMTAEQLIEGFDPLTDKYDKRILYEITGRKLEQQDYWDDSDQDPDSDPTAHVQDLNKVSDLSDAYKSGVPSINTNAGDRLLEPIE